MGIKLKKIINSNILLINDELIIIENYKRGNNEVQPSVCARELLYSKQLQVCMHQNKMHIRQNW